MSHKKVVFMGTPEFAVPVLEAIVKSPYKVSCVYTQPGKKSNRGQKINISPIHHCAENLKLIVKNPKNLNSEEEFEFIKKINPDIVVVVAYGQLISKKILNIPKEGFINIHASLLPKWRGAAPIQRSIMNSDAETGISIMQIVEELDAGPIIKKIKIKINNSFTTKELSISLSRIGSDTIVEILDDIFRGKVKFTEQNHKLATYAKKIQKKEAEINWNESAQKILAKINGLNPNPGAWFMHKNIRYKIWRAKIVKKDDQPGKIIDEKFTIACGNKSLEVIEIQKEGKNKLFVKDFLMGVDFKKGDQIK
ncbi:methionyl-tRNA formyltransferase [Pelagibacteraceae bacterium]|nr:methionyl-tRNA formyltransferase [Pelagibacteraceae bacterium]|tara:strand:+ start:826 stop:1749 length:924 start_codon:yes stop_codon:yes gene_type:complete